MQGGPGVFKGDLWFYRVDGDFRDRVGEIDTARCPLYLLTGEYDFSCTPDDTRATAEKIPGARFTVMKEIGHFPMSENPEQFRKYLAPVLDEIRLAGALTAAGNVAHCRLLRLGLLQPEAHAHVAVHRRRGGEVLAGLLALARAPVELAEAEVAVGDERAHLELLGERERVTVVAVSVLRRIAAGGDLAEEAEGPRLVGALTAPRGQGSGLARRIRAASSSRSARTYASPRYVSKSGCTAPNPNVSLALSACSSNRMPSATRPESA